MTGGVDRMGETQGDAMWSPNALYGIRTWEVSDQSDYGFSLHGHWMGRSEGGWPLDGTPMEAKCLVNRHPWAWGRTMPPTHSAPDVNCTCGVYAWTFEESFMQLSTMSTIDPPVMGVVELTGRVVEHDRGYRAERARIVELAADWAAFRESEWGRFPPDLPIHMTLYDSSKVGDDGGHWRMRGVPGPVDEWRSLNRARRTRWALISNWLRRYEPDTSVPDWVDHEIQFHSNQILNAFRYAPPQAPQNQVTYYSPPQVRYTLPPSYFDYPDRFPYSAS